MALAYWYQAKLMLMTPESVRQKLQRQLRDRNVDLATASRALGRSHAYLQQFIQRGKPRYLHEEDRRGLIDLYHIQIEGLVPPPKKSVERQVPLSLTPRPGDPIHDLREANLVGAWRKLPKEEQDLLSRIVDAWGDRHNSRTRAEIA